MPEAGPAAAVTSAVRCQYIGRPLSGKGFTRGRRPTACGCPVYNERSRRIPVEEESRMRLGLPELLVILFIVLLIFGANRLPDLAKGLGKSIKNFKDATREGEDEKKP
jgi:sec-independent protein translocase protein TatA